MVSANYFSGTMTHLKMSSFFWAQKPTGNGGVNHEFVKLKAFTVSFVSFCSRERSLEKVWLTFMIITFGD